MQSTPAPACSSSQGLWGHFWAISTKLKCDPHVPRYPWAQREEVCLRSLHLIHLTQRHGQPAASPPAGPASIPRGDLKKRGNFSFLAACWYPMARHVTAPAAGAAQELKAMSALLHTANPQLDLQHSPWHRKASGKKNPQVG